MKNPLTMTMENPLAPVNKRIHDSMREQAGAIDKFEEQNEWMNVFNKAESMAPDVSKLKDFYVEPDLGPEKHGYERIQQIRAEDKRYIEAWNYIKEIKKLTDDTDKMDELLVDFAEQVFGRVVDGLFRSNLPLPLSMIAPAATVGSCFLGFPHTHQHPPSLTPPNPVPIPVMAAGPILTGNPTVLIGGLPAATAGELGMAIGCCSLSPYFKIFTGSHKVSIGGKRAARMGDVVKYCQPGPKVPEGEKAPAAPTKGATFKESFDALKDTVKKDIKKKREDKLEAVYKAGIKENSKKAKEKGKELKAKYDTWKAAQEKAAEKRSAAAEAPDDPQAQADAAAAEAEAEDATAIALADAELTVAALASNAMDMLRKAIETFLGKDPGVPPPYGMILNGAPRVWIAGFPMPESSVLRDGLKKCRTPKGDAKKEGKLDPKNPSKRVPAEPSKGDGSDAKKEETKKEAGKQKPVDPAELAKAEAEAGAANRKLDREYYKARDQLMAERTKKKGNAPMTPDEEVELNQKINDKIPKEVKEANENASAKHDVLKKQDDANKAHEKARKAEADHLKDPKDPWKKMDYDEAQRDAGQMQQEADDARSYHLPRYKG